MELKRLLYSIFLLLLFVVGIIFALLNRETITINYYFGRFNSPLFLVIFVSLAIGIIIVGILGVLERYRMVFTIRRQKKTIAQLGSQLEELRQSAPEEKESEE